MSSLQSAYYMQKHRDELKGGKQKRTSRLVALKIRSLYHYGEASYSKRLSFGYRLKLNEQFKIAEMNNIVVAEDAMGVG